jgi:protein O-mannosyl-transferase
LVPGKKNIKQKQNPVKKTVLSHPVGQPKDITSHKYFIPAVIFVLCVLLYGNTIFNDYTLDDGIVTTQNSFIRQGFSALKDIFDKGSLYGWDKTTYVQQYRPLTLLCFMAEVSIFGLNPHAGHLINVLLFAFCMVVLYLFLQKILSPQDSSVKKYNQAIILAATLLFAFHPIHTEVVASIKSRDEILSLLLGLISFYFMMSYLEEKKNSYSFFSLTSFFLALFCKESALTFVAIVPLILYFFTSLEIKKIAVKSLPYVGLALIYLFIRSRILSSMTFENQIGVMDNSLMATNNSMDRMATSFVMFGKYIFMTIVPYPLSYDYSYNQIPIVSWGNVMPILSVLVCIGLIGFMFWGAIKKSIFSFLIALFFITIFLSSNIVIKIAASFAERFLFVPSLSFCVAFPILAAKAVKLNPSQLIWKKKINFYIPMACLLLVYTIIVIPRNAVWKNNYTLFSSGVISAPNSSRAHRFLEFQYADTAMTTKDSAKKIKYFNLAIHETKRALEINSQAPDWMYDMGEYYKEEGNRDSAIIAYKSALKMNPKYPIAANSLGAVYFNKTEYDSALKYFFISYNADPTYLSALENIAVSYLGKKDYSMAFHYDSIVLEKEPGNKATLTLLSHMHNDVAIQYINNNDLNNALKELQIAFNYDSNSVNSIGNMGIVYQKMGQTEKAKACYQRAIAKGPNDQLYAQYLQSLKGVGNNQK